MSTMNQENFFRGKLDRNIIKNQKPLNPRRMPDREKFVGREEELDTLASKIGYLVDGGDGLLVTGNTGYGKTVTIKFLLKDINEEIERKGGTQVEKVYINGCSSQNEALRSISESLRLGGSSEDDFSRAKENDRHYRLIENYLKEGNKIILVLDEIDELFLSKRKNHGNKLIKNLIDVSSESQEVTEGGISIIGITNEIDIKERFDAQVTSRFSEHEVQFPPYNAMEINRILEQRAEDAFHNGVLKDGVISKCSAKVASADGDARKAIKMLKKAAQIAEDKDRDKVSKDHVDLAEERIERDRTLEAVNNLPRHEKILLYAILDMRNNQAITGEIYSKYEIKCKKIDINPLSQRRVQDLLDDLDMLGLINEEITRAGSGRGRTRKVNTDYSDEMQKKIIGKLEDDLFT